MNEFLLEYGLFLAKTLTILLLGLITIGLIVLLKSKIRATDKLEVKHLNSYYEQLSQILNMQLMAKKAFIKKLKAEKAQKKKQEKQRKRIFILNFQGDIRATAVESLREEITAVLSVATAEDEVLLRLENAGGLVHEHGLATSQLSRIRERHIPLTILVDKIAASGGYMMACVGNRIIAAPFAIIGSIGALVQLPNFHRLLDKHGVDFEQIKAGELKRTLTIFGNNTDADRQRAQAQVDDIHRLFKECITHYRPQVDITQAGTGQYWHATQAKDLNLVDDLKTSDDYLFAASQTADLYEINYSIKKTLSEKFLSRAQLAMSKTFNPF
ncbi:peptidase S49 domain-containing protein [Candidatus Nitrosoglobus terrae]|uniref:Peptidase S49 domain-containing protein n=1 Tax=Candidatus Nitrosoglobus terrae TaxID=1630141 RepID=A0A1Q2SMB4_9GAMM|nr:protease SohB [Candidatus Nitrosoglobus terrae]BAW80276.1 peptidase S49 domain-containing protein [Candidatus Nitrosoglobus terrae]